MFTHRMGRAGAAVLCALLVMTGCSSGDDDPEASADSSTGPPQGGDQWVVTVGDSYISGEGTRWAGNTEGSPKPVDAQGRRAYFDEGTQESEPGCHRSAVSIANVGGDFKSMNLACSGATTGTDDAGEDFKPGIDFYDDGQGNIGQALALKDFAAENPVKAVVVSIGGNDFNFSSIVTTCATNFVSSAGKKKPTYCKDDATIGSYLNDGNIATVTGKIAQAFKQVAGAMQLAGYARNDYSIIALTYPSPIPSGDAMRYPETVEDRFDSGGCPVFDADADWANDVLLPAINGAVAQAVEDSGLSNISLLDMSQAFDGHRVCEEGVAELTETDLSTWEDDGADQQLEWVNKAYTAGAPWQSPESFHPNYFGMLTEQACVSAALESTDATHEPCVASE